MTAELPDTTGEHETALHRFDPARLEASLDLGLSEAADPEMERFAQRVRDQLGVPVALVSLVESDQEVLPGPRGLPAPWSELDVVSYAERPLTDDDGLVLGSLCAIDVVDREWTPHQLNLLAELAQDCSNELRLRLSRLDARRERKRLQLQTDQSTRMLSIVEGINETRSVIGIRARVNRLVDGFPDLITARLHLAQEIDESPSGLSPAVLESARQREVVGVADLHADTSVVCAPVVGSSELLGVIELLWTAPHPIDDQELTMIAAIASYVAQALERARMIEHRTGVAHQLQTAMLTTLPDVPGLPMAACYVPADADESVGGDWYDSIVLPIGEHGGGSRDLVVAVTVGDVIGHDMSSAAMMGQARAMLRQAAFDFPGHGPAEVFTQFERACAALDVPARGTAVLAYLERSAGDGSWSMRWTSAGHPPPLLALADGSVERLELSAEDQGILFGYRDVCDEPRVDSRVELPAGSTVLFYSDGVIEVPTTDVDELLDELGDLLRDHHGRGAQAVVDAVSMQFGSGSDDLVAVAVQIPGRRELPGH